MVKVKPVQNGRTTRMSFSRINEVIGMPNLIEIQKNSYNWFLEEGLHEVFHDIAAIEDYTGNLVLEFVDYRLDKNPKYSIKECKERDATYAAPLYVTARLFNKQTGEVKEQEIFMGDFPLMTDAGTFISNGAERAIVSQLVRSPGVFYGSSKDRTGKDLFTATMNPNRGAWLEYETDSSDVYYVRIDKNRKLPVTTLLRALGLSTDEQIKQFFGDSEPKINASLEKDITHNTEEGLLEVYRKLRPGEPPTVENSRAHLNNLFFDPRRYDLARFGRYKMNNKLSLTRRIAGYRAAEDIIAPLTGELLAAKGEKINMAKAEEIDNAGVTRVTILVEKKGEEPRPFIVISNGCVNAQNFFSFDVEAEAGVNERANFAEIRKILDTTSDVEEQKELLRQNHDVLISRTVTVDDIFASVNYLLGLDHGIGTTDEIDHLGNRRVRSVGELLQNQFRIGFSRMERVIRERMTLQNQENGEITPQSLVNIRPVVAAIKEFIGSSPLSQFMDQNNPLAELTHKRRLSALGPGGLSRDRAGFEVRDVHYTHYGRLCPIETPEGPNIGLISYLATYAKINKYGFVEAPYRKVDKATGTVTDEVVYMTADEEDEYIVAQANEPLDENNHFVRPRVSGRHRNDIQEFDASQVDYMDVSPRMMVSVATACIPFLENDDCNRALMGSNMQRQAVPLMVTQQPLVATGMEYKAATDSGVCVLAAHDGTVEYVDADKIIVRCADGSADTYELIKFMRSNQGNCNNQRPIVNVGETVKAGDVLADGPATRNGEISLGKNALIGFMTWEGYNYEDAVLLNEKIVREDVYTSIHIEEYETESRDTKLGPEEITRDIPNVSEDEVVFLTLDRSVSLLPFDRIVVNRLLDQRVEVAVTRPFTSTQVQITHRNTRFLVGNFPGELIEQFLREFRSGRIEFHPEIVGDTGCRLALKQRIEFIYELLGQIGHLRDEFLVEFLDLHLLRALARTFVLFARTAVKLRVDHHTVQRRLRLERSILYVAGFVTEDRTEQLLLGRRIALALRGDLTDQDIARMYVRADTDDTVRVQVLRSVLADVRNIGSQLLDTAFGIAYLHNILVYVHRGKDVFALNTLRNHDSILEVVTLPGHESYLQVASQCQFTLLGRITLGQNLPLGHLIARQDGRLQGDRRILVRTAVTGQFVRRDFRFE